MKLLNSIRKGMFSIADSYIQPGVYARLSYDAFCRDNLNLRNDVARLGNGMRKAITTYGERSYQSKGN